MKKNRIIASIVCLLLCLALTSCTTVEADIMIPADSAIAAMNLLFGSGSGNTQPPVTQAPATQAPLTEAPATEAPATQAPLTEAPATEAPATQAPATEAPATQAPATEAPATQAPATEAPANVAPSTKEEIINYYVTAYNKIATESKSITRTYDYTNQYNNILDINGNETLEKIAGTLMTKFMVENKEPLTMDINGVPPVGISTLSITPDKVSSAECKDNGDSYIVTLKSTGSDDNWEIDSMPGVGSAGCIGPLLRTEDVAGAAGGFIKFDGLHTWYGTASVDATIDKATGHITQLHFLTPSVLHFDKVTAVVVKVNNCNIGLLFHQDYTIAY